MSTYVTLTTKKYSDLLNNTKGATIIESDFNALQDLWESHTVNASGSNFVNALNQSSLVLLNDSSPTKISRSGCKSVVDLTVCSTNIANKIDWSIMTDTLGYDHFSIKIKLNFFPVTQIETIFPKNKWNIKKANWQQYEFFSDAIIIQY